MYANTLGNTHAALGRLIGRTQVRGDQRRRNRRGTKHQTAGERPLAGPQQRCARSGGKTTRRRTAETLLRPSAGPDDAWCSNPVASATVAAGGVTTRTKHSGSADSRRKRTTTRAASVAGPTSPTPTREGEALSLPSRSLSEGKPPSSLPSRTVFFSFSAQRGPAHSQPEGENRPPPVPPFSLRVAAL